MFWRISVIRENKAKCIFASEITEQTIRGLAIAPFCNWISTNKGSSNLKQVVILWVLALKYDLIKCSARSQLFLFYSKLAVLKLQKHEKMSLSM
ncbi:MAG: hypothetical protein KME05_19460 [Gloeocapsa sp. UFS-A4-WI-NPMV-4B04]|nr:hypothetical protein [Gloeocapsa sp. UFS-A4-WI-NPMV-4B04]